MVRPVIVIGGGDHAKVVIDTLIALGRQILGYTDPDKNGGPLLGVKWLGGDEAILRVAATKVTLINGIGIRPFTSLRREIYEKFSAKGYSFDRLVHPSAVIASEVDLDEGVQVMARAVIQPGTRVGLNSIINTSASIDHDCIIEAHAHIAPGVILCGHVRVGERAFVGCGARIIQNVKIGSNSTVGAGAVALEDVPPNSTVVGVPARAWESKAGWR